MTTIAQFMAAAGRTPPLRAPYNFVPLNAKVLESPWGQDGPDHGMPHADGLNGELVVDWIAETPLLVGGSDNNSPFQLGAGGPFAIPGASLRGMIRAVLEILSYAHLELYDDQRFALRDYDAVTWQKVQRKTNGRPVRITKPNGQVITVHLPFAGWLQKAGEMYQLTGCEQVDVPIADIAAALGISTSDWHCASLHNRHGMLLAAGLSGVIDLGRISTALVGQRGTLVVAGLIKSEVNLRRTGTGTPTNKKKEAAFLDLPSGTPYPISEAFFEAFAAIQVKDSNQATGAPEENWSYWAGWLETGSRVPVFYRGDPAAAANRVPAPSEFVMALTRLMRVPYSFTTREVVDRTQKTPLSATKLDFVQALFGFVPPEEINVSKPKGRQRAWRGRVRFGIATLAEGQQAAMLAPRPAVTMKPRASFYPFYLRPKPLANQAAVETVKHPVDWSSPDAILAGRKRYPPRNTAREQLPIAPHEPGEQPNQELQNNLVFLNASPDAPLKFRSAIRFHNLLPEELGGLLWAIGLCRPGGSETRRLRHMLGRTKGFGYGQVKAEIVEGDAGGWIEPNATGAAPTLAKCAERFEQWVIQGFGRTQAFSELPEVAAFLALSDADLGERLQDALRFPLKPEAGTPADEAERILAAYSDIRKRSACRNTNHPEWLGGQPISRDPADDAFLFLPEYPQP